MQGVFATIRSFSVTKWWLTACFILCALPLGLAVAFITPPGQSPDEPAQTVRAAGLLHGAVLAVRKPVMDATTRQPAQWSGVKADTGLIVAAFGIMTPVNDHLVFTQADATAWRTAPVNHIMTFFNVPNTGPCFPAVYVPAALGLAVGSFFHLSPSACFLLARLATLLAYLILGASAILVARFGEALILTILLMPMTVFLGGTLHQDGILIAATCLACAAATCATLRARVVGLALFALVLSSKPPYILLIAAFLLPLKDVGLRRRMRQVGLALAPVCLWIALSVLFVSVPFDHPPYHPGPLYSGDPNVLFDHSDPGFNLHILLSHPTLFVTLPIMALQQDGVQRLREMIGVLGALQIVLPNIYYELWGTALMIAICGLLFCPRDAKTAPSQSERWDSALMVAVMIITVWGIFIAQYLSWTHVGSAEIDGIEGRYFLILLPFLLFVVPRRRTGRFLIPAWIPAAPACALGIFDLGYIPVKLLYSFYLH